LIDASVRETVQVFQFTVFTTVAAFALGDAATDPGMLPRRAGLILAGHGLACLTGQVVARIIVDFRGAKR
jgi:hypothetical protein